MGFGSFGDTGLLSENNVRSLAVQWITDSEEEGKLQPSYLLVGRVRIITLLH